MPNRMIARMSTVTPLDKRPRVRRPGHYARLTGQPYVTRPIMDRRPWFAVLPEAPLCDVVAMFLCVFESIVELQRRIHGAGAGDDEQHGQRRPARGPTGG